MRKSITLLVAAWAVASLVACGGSSTGSANSADNPAATTTAESATGAPVSAAKITIANFRYSPATLTVAPGATITVTNKDAAPHDVDSDDRTSFNTKPVGKGGTFTFTAPMTPGTYGYFCSVHPDMHGTLIVA